MGYLFVENEINTSGILKEKRMKILLLSENSNIIPVKKMRKLMESRRNCVRIAPKLRPSRVKTVNVFFFKYLFSTNRNNKKVASFFIYFQNVNNLFCKLNSQ